MQQLEKDAERYRKLRRHVGKSGIPDEYVEIDGIAFVYPSELDEAVDALKEATPQ